MLVCLAELAEVGGCSLIFGWLGFLAAGWFFWWLSGGGLGLLAGGLGGPFWWSLAVLFLFPYTAQHEHT